MPVTPQPALSAPRCPVFPRCEQVNASRTHPAQADCRGPQTGPGIGADCTNHQTECCAREATVLVPPIPPPGQPPPGKPASPGWQTAATDSIARRRTIHSPNSHHGRICLCGGNLRVDPSRRAVRTTASRTNRLLWGRRSRNTASEPGVPVPPLQGPERSSTRVLAVHSALPVEPDSRFGDIHHPQGESAVHNPPKPRLGFRPLDKVFPVVKPEFQGKGIGRRLVAAPAGRAQRGDCRGSSARAPSTSRGDALAGRPAWVQAAQTGAEERGELRRDR